MRARVGVAASLAAFGLISLAACGFGVDLDGLFGESTDGGAALDATAEGGDAQVEAGIPSVQVEQLAMGSNFGCGRRIDGTVMCWGESSSSGELGDSLKLSSSIPVLVKDVSDAIDLAAGRHHACIVRRTGKVSCWGENELRQLGDGTVADSPTPKDVVALVDAQRVAAGNSFSCALLKDGTVRCWGDNAEGQLGDGTVTPRSQPAPVSGLADVTQIASAQASACALVKAGEVLCWGNDSVGQTATPPPTDLKVPVKVAGLTGVTSIAASADANHFCAVTQAGDVRCWGAGGSGNLGNAKSDNSAVPVVVLSINDAVGVTTGGAHSCAWRKSGAVACWGNNAWRQVGLGDTTPTTDVSTPLPVDGLSAVTQVVAGAAHTCALLGDGKRISCWGTNVSGALGRGSRVSTDVPVKVATTASVAGFALGGDHGCAVDTQGGMSCWGDNGYRQGSVTTHLATGTPTAVPGVAGVTRAAGGEIHTCALGAGGLIQCWGNGQYGALGNGAAPYIQAQPVLFATTAATDVGAGYYFTCALLGTTDVACAGLNSALRLGRTGGDLSTPALVPTDAGPDAGAEAGAPPFGATKLSVSPGHACVIRTGGVVTCWGSNGTGQCGVGASGGTLPVDVPLPLPAKEIAAGGAHSCAVLQDGSVRCWGLNNHGQTTGAAPDGPSLRTPDLGGKTAKAITAGDGHSCALLTDGTLLCWGQGTLGAIGQGVRADATSPVAVKNLATVKTVAARGDRTCASLDDGSGYCWGNNRTGELGDGTTITTGVAAPIVGY